MDTKIKNRILTLLHYHPGIYKLLKNLSSQDVSNQLLSRILINQIREKGVLATIQEAEFKVCSQFGDDGIIQYLIENTKIKSDEKNFIEIGVEDYLEANTRFLLINNNWSGLIIDANKDGINYVKKDDIYWKHDLKAIHSFVTKKNINTLINRYFKNKKIGILSIDIDGNDYWIWQAINVIDPNIVIVEYNGLFGYKKAVTIPYKPSFSRIDEHYSGLYWGCSLKALKDLGKRRGYEFVGTNSAGNNAYFIKKEKMGKVSPIKLCDGFTEPKYRESKNMSGSLTFIGGDERLKLIKNKPLYNLDKKEKSIIREIYNL